MHLIRLLAALTLTGVLAAAVPAAAQSCSASPLALQILGSGGPFPSASASSGYLIWRDGQSIALVDAGGGVFHTFGQAGGHVEQLAVLALSHLHADHVADLPALLWLSDYRKTPLPVIGPSGNALAPPADLFIERLVGEKDSAFPLVHARGATLQVQVVDVAAKEPTVVLDTGGMRVTALGVPHGVPALAYRVTVGGTTLVFGGDQSGTNPAFVEFARDADLLVAHLSLASGATAPQLTGIHALPALIGRIAAQAHVGALVLSHVIEPRRDDPLASSFSGFDAATLTAAVADVRKSYGGVLVAAKDLQCIVLRPAEAK